MGIISGYPVGAKIVTEFRKNGECTKAEAERLLAFTNNSGPLFIIGTVRNKYVWRYFYSDYFYLRPIFYHALLLDFYLDFGNIKTVKI